MAGKMTLCARLCLDRLGALATNVPPLLFDHLKMTISLYTDADGKL